MADVCQLTPRTPVKATEGSFTILFIIVGSDTSATLNLCLQIVVE